VSDQPGPKVLGFAPEVVRWQRLHGRRGLPWQADSDPYRIWLSEVMLQQTQVATVIPYFNAFVGAFPTVADLARAPLEQVMALWSGLGYYSRARNLHACATHVVHHHGGVFPGTAAALAELPGVGRSTAAAIAVFGFGERAAILDGNVKRVFCRVFAIDGDPAKAATQRRLWAHAQAELPPPASPPADIRAYTQGLMDLGATLCTRARPDCGLCPLRGSCQALRGDAVERYPTARARREVPVREVDMLLICDRRCVLIEQRPPAGIWGGLWSLPEIGIAAGGKPLVAGDKPLVAGGRPLAAGGLLLAASRFREFMRFEHLFTHFRMRARVWRADLDGPEAALAVHDADASRWLALDDAATAPLPRPVKSLLQSMAGDRLLEPRPEPPRPAPDLPGERPSTGFFPSPGTA